MRAIFGYLLWATSCWGDGLGADRVYRSAVAHDAAGRLEEAIEGYTDVLLEAPQYPGLRERLKDAVGRLVQEERQEAADLSARVLREAELWKKYASAVRRYREDGRSRWRVGLDEAVLEASSAGPRMVAARTYLNALGAFPVLSGERRALERGRAEFRRALGRRPTRPAPSPALEAPDELAVAKPVDASEIIAVESKIDKALAVADAAYALFEEGRFAESSAMWRKVLRHSPQNPQALYFLGLSRTRMEEP